MVVTAVVVCKFATALTDCCRDLAIRVVAVLVATRLATAVVVLLLRVRLLLQLAVAITLRRVVVETD